MTRDAINELKKYTLGKKNTEKVEISVLRLNRVIKALEQEPCEDCISRKQAYESAKFIFGSDSEMKAFSMMKMITELPSVTPKEKVGHWIYICNSEVNGLKIVECSECGKRTYGSGKYCPNCGARMEDKE